MRSVRKAFKDEQNETNVAHESLQTTTQSHYHCKMGIKL